MTTRPVNGGWGVAATAAVAAVVVAATATWAAGRVAAEPPRVAAPPAMVPFADIPADPVPPQVGAFDDSAYVVAPTSAPACSADQLVVSRAGSGPNADGGSNLSIYFFDVRNVGSDCALGGLPDATIIDEQGNAAGVALRPMRAQGPPESFMLTSGSTASTVLTWGRDCSRVAGRPFALNLGPGKSRGMKRTAQMRGPGCRTDATEPFATLRTWELSADKRRNTPRRSPFDTSGLQVEVRTPPVVRRGEPFSYEVLLTNPTDRVVRLTPCPAYTVNMGAETVGLYKQRKVNCDQAPAEIAPGDMILLAMEDVVPDHPSLVGERTLRWDLSQYPSETTPQDDATTSVT